MVLRCEARYLVLVAGRRWGKTTIAVWWLFTIACARPNSVCYYVTPTARQAKRVAWNTLKDMVPPEARRSTSEQELTVVLPNGSLIQLLGATKADTLRGVGLDGIVLDEYALMAPDVWEAIVRPMLADRRGRALFISTPKGFNHFYDLFQKAHSMPNWSCFQFPSKEGGYIPADELTALACDTPDRIYRQEYGALFEPLESRIYYAFERRFNVMPINILPDVVVFIGVDFNIHPMTAVVAQRAGDQCQVFDEIVLPNSNTQDICAEIKRRYPGRQIVVYPDPTGVARKTSSPVGQTDFTIMRQAGFKVYDATRPYKIIDRFNTVNTMLRNANGQRRLFIAPNCVQLITALERHTYKQGTMIPDKSTGFDHITDALGYLIMNAFPMTASTVKIGQFVV